MKMKLRLKHTIITLMMIIAAFTIINAGSINASAKVKNGTYLFSSCNTKTFKVKKNKLTIKMTGKYGEITKKGNTTFSKKKMTVKVAKNCKYYTKYFSRTTGKQSISKSTYKKVKNYIDGDTSKTNNVGLSEFRVKNGKVVKIIYFSM